MDSLKLNDVAYACRECTKCELGRRIYNGLSSNMPLDDNRSMVYMLVGNCPSNDDLNNGGIFKGTWFKQFEEMLYSKTGLCREDFYMTNICKCCLYGVRQPSDAEIRKCSGYLADEIEAIKPNLILGLGKNVLKFLTGLDSLDKYHGKPVFSARFRTYVFPMFIPTLKRFTKPADRKAFEEDIEAFAREIRAD